MLEAFLAHPLLWGVICIVALAVALTGRLSLTAATWLLWIAYAAATFGILRTNILSGDPTIKLLSALAIASILAIGAVLLQRWFRGKPMIAREAETLHRAGVAVTSAGSGEVPPQSESAPTMVAMTEAQFQGLMSALAKGSHPPTVLDGSGSSLNSDLRYTFYGRDRLYFVYSNPSPYVASKPRITFGLMDLTNPYSYSVHPGERPTAQPFPIPTRVLSNDYIRPGESAGYEDLLSNFMGHIKGGDIIWGVAWITCVDCARNRAYYVYWKAGDGGWYAETDPKRLQLPKPVMTPFSDSQVDEYVDKLVPLKERQHMKEKFSP